jgi:adenylate kinase family enzyme
MNKLIIISGHSCTGKTTLGIYLANKFNFPFYSKDSFKEIMFDFFGWQDRDLEWSRQLGAASMALLYSVLEEALKRKQPIIIEANFKPELDLPKIQTLLEQYHPEVIEVHCFANPDVLFERFTKRFQSGQRHPGHLDDQRFEIARQNFANKEMHSTLNLGKVIEVDATDFEKVDYEKIVNKLN